MQTDDAMHLPAVVFLFPQGDKPAGFGYRIGFFLVVEGMQADLNGPKAIYFVDFHASRDQLPGHLPANIGLNALEDLRPGSTQATLVMIEFKILAEQFGLGLHITGVIGREISVIQGDDLAVKLGIRSFLGRNPRSCQQASKGPYVF